MATRYRNSDTRVDKGRTYLTNKIYPDIPLSENDIYLITTIGDRLDVLAQDYYGDPSLWWLIASANAELNRDSLIPTPGLQIRIPADKEFLITYIENFNFNR